jgi:Icc-related predicted phosphoesterase
MVKICFLSDTHLRHGFEIPDADILVHCGDATLQGRIEEVSTFARWMERLPHRHKIFVAGNHDFLFERNATLAKEMLPKSVTYLKDEMVEIEGIKFYGAPYTPQFGYWAFMYNRGKDIATHWARIPDNVDVLITHGPPHGVLDTVMEFCRDAEYRPLNVGCEELRKVVDRIQPQIHAFGHIHRGYGTERIGKTLFINAAICDEGYRAVNRPILVDFDNGKVI